MGNDQQRLRRIVSIGQLLPEELQEPVSFEEVELTEEEAAAALLEGRKKKAAILEDDRKKALAALAWAEANTPWKPKQLWEFARSRGVNIIRAQTGNPSAEFRQIEWQLPIINALSLYFTGVPGFENLDPDIYNKQGHRFALNKGLWIWGNPGIGKTLLMQMFRINKRQCFDIVSCPKLVSAYIKNGDEAINAFKTVVECPKQSETFYQGTRGICFNDLGTEQLAAKHYANPLNVMETLLLEAYENHVPWWHRHVTTNLTFDQVRDAYGARVTDRIRQSFNIIEIQGVTQRKA